MFSQLSWEKQSDSGLNLSGRDGLSLVVVSKSRSFSGNSLENVIHEGVHDRHALRADASIGMNLLQDFVDVDRVRFLPLLPAFLIASNTASLLPCLFLGFLSSNWRHLD